jgi:GntR family transcriptional regulator, transcriptional repressor for pyruvate dehydrogenase complex
MFTGRWNSKALSLSDKNGTMATMPEDLQDRILRHFRDLELSPGDTIPSEQSLTVELGVSRSALREAFAGLESFGIVNATQGARRTLGAVDMASVVHRLLQTMYPSIEVLLELLDVRRVLEAAFFPSVAANMPEARLRELRRIVDRMHEKASRGLPFIEEDASFHTALYESLDNKTLEGLVSAFWQMFEQMSSQTQIGKDLPESARSHSRIVEALESRDATLALHRLNVHFFDVRTRLTAAQASQRLSQTPQKLSHP